ncbi:MAG TPA: pyridoxamine 5'-phosphate oxidase family protein [Pseudonocardiaceae bacterium]|nr:pyridoxamine 5'-phosphate oxidase family protein [Pseudonocardiaceae bacterium]
MAEHDPAAVLMPNSTPGSTVTPWDDARERFGGAPVYWLATVRPDGRPHVMPVQGVWADGAAYFCTFHGSVKDQNLGANPHVTVTFGQDALDLIVEGAASTVTDELVLNRVGDAYKAKYGWQVAVRDGVFFGDSGSGMGEIPWAVYEVAPARAFGFATDKGFSATRWTF